MSYGRLFTAFGVCALCFGVSSKAHAQIGAWGMGLGAGWYNSTYSLSPPPHFAIFPPVYYSHVTPRPYGFSPFAYPGFMPTPERIRMPSTPYASPSVRMRRAAATQTAAVPITIKNPYVLPESERPERLADGRPLPQVISLRETHVASTAD